MATSNGGGLVVMEEEPMLCRLNRLDYIVKQLEAYSPTPSRSSCAYSTNSSSANSPPPALEKQCRPLEEVLMEVQQKGTFIQRLIHAEDRIFKICMQLEEEMGWSKRQKEEEDEDHIHQQRSKKGRGLKKLVKSCVKFNKKRDT